MNRRICNYIECTRPVERKPKDSPEVRIKTHRRYCVVHGKPIDDYRARQFRWPREPQREIEFG